MSKIGVGVYIDGSNIYYGGRKAGWQVDYAKLKAFIETAPEAEEMPESLKKAISEAKEEIKK